MAFVAVKVQEFIYKNYAINLYLTVNYSQLWQIPVTYLPVRCQYFKYVMTMTALKIN